MIRASIATAMALASLALLPGSGSAQTWTIDDPVLERIWEMGMEESQLEGMGRALLDSIGPRLTGSPGMDRAHEWAVQMLEGWGVAAENEEYGTWRGWDRGITHVDLLEPRVRTLEATQLAWSPASGGPIEGPVTVVPAWDGEEEYRDWLENEVPGSFVAISFPQPTCRPDSHYEVFGTSGALARLTAERTEAEAAFGERIPSQLGDFRLELEAEGALGILQSGWTTGTTGVNRIFGTNTATAPTIDLSCEDYGLVTRLAEGDQGPILRVNVESEDLGEVPVHNTLGRIEGTELPDEYVILSAHFDSWDGASGATDNGTGSITMLEVMRILSEVYPNPRRTILIALWGGEEQGLNGSRRFAAMHPEIVENMQALFNQDNGTGRVVNISMQGLVEAGEHWGRWASSIPPEITDHINLGLPGVPSSGGTDHASFICAGAPAFSLSSLSWAYGSHTWHTNRDTFDKLVFEELRNNATLIAMLAYLASEDPEQVSRTQRSHLPGGAAWPQCQPGQSSFGG